MLLQYRFLPSKATLVLTQPRAAAALAYRRSVPVTTISTRRLPHREHTSRPCQSGTGILGPVALSHLGGVRHAPIAAIVAPDEQAHLSAVALPSVIGGPL
jgi:hypothetical protein